MTKAFPTFRSNLRKDNGCIERAPRPNSVYYRTFFLYRLVLFQELEAGTRNLSHPWEDTYQKLNHKFNSPPLSETPSRPLAASSLGSKSREPLINLTPNKVEYKE